MRRALDPVLTEIAGVDEQVIVLVGDVGYGVFDMFRKTFPERFMNLGLCEQSLIGVAAGMALTGWKPYVYTITPFLIERPFEQIKIDIDLQNANVKLVGYADYPTQGPTHAEIDARILMSLFPNIVSYFPRNCKETAQFLRMAYTSEKPAFLSLKRDENP